MFPSLRLQHATNMRHDVMGFCFARSGTCHGEVARGGSDAFAVFSFALEGALVRLGSSINDESLHAVRVVCFRFVARVRVCHHFIVHEPLLEQKQARYMYRAYPVLYSGTQILQ